MVNGGRGYRQAFAELPFDHLFFTGSTAVGRKIALAAAANLTPVTLELGGKSPALVHEDADIAALAPRLVAGKLLNAGQTCIAPDYVLAPAARVDALVQAIGTSVRALYPTLATIPTTPASSTIATMPGSRRCRRRTSQGRAGHRAQSGERRCSA